MKILNPRFLAVSVMCGGLGVLSGYAIYLTYWQVSNARPDQYGPKRFLLTLLVTALISYVIEWIRELIRRGKIENTTHPVLRTMATFVIVMTFELFVNGFHTTLDFSGDDVRGASNLLLGEEANVAGGFSTALLAAGLWVVVGAMLAVWLSQSVKKTSGTTWQRIMRAGRAGLIGGLIFAPVVMGLYILGGRCLVILLDVFNQYGGSYSGGAYQNPGSTLLHNMLVSQNTLFTGWFSSALIFCVTLPLTLLNMAAQKSLGLFMACYLGMAAFVVGYPAIRKLRASRSLAVQIVLGAIWVVCLVYAVVPFGYAMFRVARQLADVAGLVNLGKIYLSGALIWAIPGLLLGGLTPLLRGAAAHTRNWALVGYGSALLLMAATLWARAWWPLIPALAALVVGYMFQRGSLVYEYWPFAALCVATGICGATSIGQHMTFATEVRSLHAINVLRPAPTSQPAMARRVKLPDQLSPEEKAQLPQSGDPSFAVIYAPDGVRELVILRVLDTELVKEVEQIWNDHAEEIQRLNESISQPALPPVMPQAKDLPRPNPYIEAAIKRMNDPNAAPEPPPAPTRPPSDDLALSKEFAIINGQSPGSLPSGSKPRRNPKNPAPPVVETSSPAVASSPAATASSPTTQALQLADLSATNQDSTGSRQTDEQHKKEDAAAKALELSLSGSVGFWVTIGLLACWSMQENDEREEHPDAA